jgi:hypothetical protein
MPPMPSRPVPGSDGLSTEQVDKHNADFADKSGASAGMVGEADVTPSFGNMDAGGVFPVELNSGVKPVTFDLTAVVAEMDAETPRQKVKVSVFYFIHWYVSNFERR